MNTLSMTQFRFQESQHPVAVARPTARYFVARGITSDSPTSELGTAPSEVDKSNPSGGTILTHGYVLECAIKVAVHL